MDKLKDIFFKINAKAPVLKMLFWLSILGIGWLGAGVWEQMGFEPNFLQLYGIEDAGVVRARVEEQLRRLKPKPAPPPAPAPSMSYDIRILRQHNPFLPPGVIEMTTGDVENKFTDVTGIELIGTVYSYVPTRRTALIEMNGVAIVVTEGKTIRGTQKKVVEIARSKVVIQEEGLLPAPIFLPGEHGLDALSRALASNEYRSRANWEYSARFGKGRKKEKLETDEEEEPAGGGEKAGAAKADAKSKKKAAKAEEAAAAEEAADEDEEEEEPASTSSSAGGSAPSGGQGKSDGDGLDIGGDE